MKNTGVKPLPRQIEARIAGIHAKKTAGLDRARELLRTLPPEVSIKLDQKEAEDWHCYYEQKEDAR